MYYTASSKWTCRLQNLGCYAAMRVWNKDLWHQQPAEILDTNLVWLWTERYWGCNWPVAWLSEIIVCARGVIVMSVNTYMSMIGISTEDKYLIKSLPEYKKYGAKRLLKCFLTKTGLFLNISNQYSFSYKCWNFCANWLIWLEVIHENKRGRYFRTQCRMWAYAQHDGHPRNTGGALCWKWRGVKIP